MPRGFMDDGYGDSDIDAILAGIDDYVPTNGFRSGDTFDVFSGRIPELDDIYGMDFGDVAAMTLETMESALNDIEKAEYRRETADWDEDEDEIESAAVMLGGASYDYSRFRSKDTRASEVAKSNRKGAERGSYIGLSRGQENETPVAERKRDLFDNAKAEGERRDAKAAERKTSERKGRRL